ncbi:MAG TPA: ABC transporter ATP-binding protein [Armatimonadetes bacterium]|nr:ABC transporter ATP-binding protein [Armatimonadota bacterium]
MIQLEEVSKIYRTPRGGVRALDGVSLSVREGEFLAIKGPSGSGKSTLLLTVGGMIRPTQGRVVVDGTDIYALSAQERAKFRAENVGFVFQMFYLVPYLSVIENVLLPTASGTTRAGRKEALELLEHLGLSERVYHRPSELSVGERQRVAMARALLNKPRLLLADEPTGNLDPETASEVMGYLAEFHRGGGTIVLVTHEQVAEQHAERTLLIREGRIEAEVPK